MSTFNRFAYSSELITEGGHKEDWGDIIIKDCHIFLAQRFFLTKWSSIPQFLSYRNGKPQFLG